MKRPLLLPFVPLYAAAQALHNALRPTPRRLTRPVLSVGSLSAGGAGKTPVVEALANLLQRHGYTPVVLSRGYGRGSGVVEKVDPTGLAQRFGDEPLQLAQSGLAVYVAADRHAAGLLAESEDPTCIHLLDDGFQHRRLHRTLDLLLLTAADIADTLLPAGNLREPLRALRRADILLLRAAEAESLRPVISHQLKGLDKLTVLPTILIDRTLTLPWLPTVRPQRPLAFCALARPEDFFAGLRAQGLNLVGAIPFPDHHPYTPADIASLRATAAHVQADAFLTTAKDAVKLTPPLRAALEEVAPLHLIPLTVTFPDEPSLWPLLAPHLG